MRSRPGAIGARRGGREERDAAVSWGRSMAKELAEGAVDGRDDCAADAYDDYADMLERGGHCQDVGGKAKDSERSQ